MSNNISHWKVKKIDNFILPLKSLYDEIEDDSWRPRLPKITNPSTLEIHIKGYDGFEVKGNLVGDNIVITDINNTGEGSGTFMGYLDDAFKKSIGILEVVMIWESGEVEHMKVNNGVVTIKEVEL